MVQNQTQIDFPQHKYMIEDLLASQILQKENN